MHHFLTVKHEPIEGSVERIAGTCSCGAWLDYLHEDRVRMMSATLNEGRHGSRCPAVAMCARTLDEALVQS